MFDPANEIVAILDQVERDHKDKYHPDQRRHNLGSQADRLADDWLDELLQGADELLDLAAQIDGIAEDLILGSQPRLERIYQQLGIDVDTAKLSGQVGDDQSRYGNHNRDKKPAFPRMHNKFLVFAKVTSGETEHEPKIIEPYAVWTGSFNFTKNATNSLENALYITEQLIVNAFFNEYGQIAAMSEPLDWISDWAEPEWRIGT